MDAQLIAFAHTLADAAGDVIRPYFERELAVENKADNTPVTKADREAEAAMRTLINQHYPTHEIYGEEFGITLAGGNKASTPIEASVRSARREPRSVGVSEAKGSPSPSRKNYTWVLDPIDGTRAFIAGRKEWGTLIALCEDGVPILGMLDQPATSERWLGVAGQATQFFTHHQSRATSQAPRAMSHDIRTRACASLTDAEFSTTSLNYFTPEQASRVVTLAQSCKTTVRDGDCYAYGLLARGMRDVVIDAGLKPYDILALVPIIRGARGTITAWDGQPITLSHFSTAIAVGDAGLHSEIITILR